MTILLTLLLALNLLAAQPGVAETALRHEFLAHPQNGGAIEYFWTAPRGTGPWPAILYVHGHQIGARPGARIYLNPPLLEQSAETGFVAAAVSQPGYGRSDGPPDFCGPNSQQAVRRVLQALRENPLVRRDRIVLYGYSRGAIVASVVAAHEPSLAGVVLGGGVYDMQDAYNRLEEGPEGEESLKRNIRNEAGATPESFRERSVLLSDLRIAVPTLILHGEEDPVSPVDQARRLADRLKEWGTPVELAIFPGVAHGIPREQRKPHVDRFLDRYAR